MDERGRFRLALGFAWGTSAGVALGIFVLPLLGLDEGTALGAGVALGALVGLGAGAWLSRPRQKSKLRPRTGPPRL